MDTPSTSATSGPDILVCVATALEGDGIPSRVAGRSIEVVVTGVGPVNAAIGATRALSISPKLVVSFGIGGAYPGSGLQPGDVACAVSDMFVDLGAESPDGFLDMEALGIPVMNGDTPLFNRLPVDIRPLATAVPFVTCSTCTGTDQTATERSTRTGGAVESMEGAAIVQAAHLAHVPVAEIRGISNIAARRNRATWKIREALTSARLALLAAIEEGRC